MAEAAFRVLQLGKESTFNTAVDATTIFPCDPGSGEFTLNRATAVPDEDWGRAIRNQSGRGSHGARVATASVSAPARFEDLGHLLTMALGTAITTGSGTYVHVWDQDTTADTVKSYTFRTNDGVAPFVTTGVVVTGFQLGFDAIGPGDNQMWQVSADLQGADHTQGTATSGVSDPSALETMEGHLTTIAMGPSGTAYASLPAIGTALVSYQLDYSCEKPLRIYGGSSEVAGGVGKLKGLGTVTMLLKVADYTIDESWDIFAVSGGAPTERRVRVTCDGAGVNVMTIDHRLIFTDVHIEPDGREGERLISITAETVYDSTLGSDVEITITNAVTSY